VATCEVALVLFFAQVSGTECNAAVFSTNHKLVEEVASNFFAQVFLCKFPKRVSGIVVGVNL